MAKTVATKNTKKRVKVIPPTERLRLLDSIHQSVAGQPRELPKRLQFTKFELTIIESYINSVI